ncbi:MAG: ANTAR domain-containing protein [Ancalomicrobiaceae bacterium]|nr:ANTAR domain-containing protein [Ancalomicrobiaceae bacterium]
MTIAPTFSGWHALVLHVPDEGTDRLARQLRLLGMTAEVKWAPLEGGGAQADVVLVDADQGWDGLFPWPVGGAPMPLIALLQSEAPGRIAWAIAHGARALIAKPIAASAVYPALVLAASLHAERQITATRIAKLEERIRLRPLVHGAVRALQDSRRIDEDAAYAVLRRAAMARRLTLEQIAADIVAGGVPLTEAG